MPAVEVPPPLRALRAFAPAILAAALLWPTQAHAIDPGVIYEPGSPSAKEYAIPLEEARREAGSPGGGKNPAYAAFGVGIKPPGGGAGGGSGRGHPRGGGGTGHGGTAGGAGANAASTAALRKRLQDAESASAPGGTTPLLLLAVVAAAGLIGIVLARTQRRPAV